MILKVKARTELNGLSSPHVTNYKPAPGQNAQMNKQINNTGTSCHASPLSSATVVATSAKSPEVHARICMLNTFRSTTINLLQSSFNNTSQGLPAQGAKCINYHHHLPSRMLHPGPMQDQSSTGNTLSTPTAYIIN